MKKTFQPRRAWLVVGALAGLLPGLVPAAGAQTKMQSLGAFSLLGDAVQVVAAMDAPRDTRIERTQRESLDFKGIGFDNIALRATRSVMQKTQPQTPLSVFKAPMVMTVAEQRAIAAGAGRGELPAWLVKTIQENKLTHVMLITRTQGEPNLRTADGTGIGRGVVDGIGFYLDTLYPMQNKTTGAVSTGLIGPYVQIHLTLLDVQGAEVKHYDVRSGTAWAARDDQPKADPWDFMTAAEKVTTLRTMVDEGVTRGVTLLLSGS